MPALALAARCLFEEAFGPDNDAAVLRDYLDAAFTPEVLSREIVEDGSSFLVATDGSDIVAYSRVRRNPEADEWLGPVHIEIHRFYVYKSHHGTGLADRLMDAVLTSVASGCWIWLGVWEKNPRAIRFYQRYGFETFAQHPFRLGTEVQNDLLMRRRR